MFYTGPFELKPATFGSGAVDLSADTDGEIPPWSRQLVPTGIQIAMNPGQVGLIRARSGLSVKGLDIGAGVIDSDFRGMIKVLLINSSDSSFIFQRGDRIAQLIIVQHADYFQLQHVETLPSTDNNNRGANGFGSTGLKQLESD